MSSLIDCGFRDSLDRKAMCSGGKEIAATSSSLRSRPLWPLETQAHNPSLWDPKEKDLVGGCGQIQEGTWKSVLWLTLFKQEKEKKIPVRGIFPALGEN